MLAASIEDGRKTTLRTKDFHFSSTSHLQAFDKHGLGLEKTHKHFRPTHLLLKALHILALSGSFSGNCSSAALLQLGQDSLSLSLSHGI